jgi:uncharacterized membrane protein YphA (DoxX/SURF4 family)
VKLHPITRIPVAAVWLYQGFWCKVLGRVPHQEAVIGAVPFFAPAAAHALLIVLGIVETCFGVWVLTGWKPRIAAAAQTALLIAMNTGGVIWASSVIQDPVGMLFQNLAFLTLVWIVAVL